MERWYQGEWSSFNAMEGGEQWGLGTAFGIEGVRLGLIYSFSVVGSGMRQQKSLVRSDRTYPASP